VRLFSSEARGSLECWRVLRSVVAIERRGCDPLSCGGRGVRRAAGGSWSCGEAWRRWVLALLRCRLPSLVSGEGLCKAGYGLSVWVAVLQNAIATVLAGRLRFAEHILGEVKIALGVRRSWGGEKGSGGVLGSFSGYLWGPGSAAVLGGLSLVGEAPAGVVGWSLESASGFAWCSGRVCRFGVRRRFKIAPKP
jgi:hypothetical protein